MVRAIAAAPADLIYGGTTGALAAIAEAGRRTHTPYALDLEDYHSGETIGAEAPARRRAGRADRRGRLPRRHVPDDFERGDRRCVSPAVRRPPIRRPQHVSAAGADAVLHPRKSRCPPRLLVQSDNRRGTRSGGGNRGARAIRRPRGARAAGSPERWLPRRVEEPGSGARTPARRDSPSARTARRDDRSRACARCRSGARARRLAKPRAVRDQQGIHLHPRRAGGRWIRHSRAARHRRRSRPRGAARSARRRRRAGRGVCALGLDPAALDCARRTAWQAANRRWHWEHDAERGTLYRLVQEALS